MSIKRAFQRRAASLLSLLVVLLPVTSLAQSNPGLITGQIPTATQWNSYFSAKQDYNTNLAKGPGAATPGNVACWGTYPFLVDCGTGAVTVSGGTGINVTAGPAYSVSLNAAASDLTNGTSGTGPIILQSAPSLVNPALGTPSAITLTNGVGLPLSTGITGVLGASNGGAGTVSGALKANGSGVVSQASAADLSNGVTGSGSVVLATAPVLASPSVTGVLSVAPVSATYTVGAGGNYATLNAAITDLNKQILQPGGYVFLTLLDGIINEPTTAFTSSSFFRQVYIQGQHVYTHNVTSIQSSSGAAGAWTYVLNLDSVANITVGDYESIYGASGGTNPNYIGGVWPVTAVDIVNNRITITTTGHQAVAASGAVTATASDPKSILKFTGVDGFQIWAGATALNLGDVTVVGNGTANTNGLSLQDGDRLNVVGTVLAVSGFGNDNILNLYSSEMNGGGQIVTSSAGNNGIEVTSHAVLDTQSIVSSGNGKDGIRVYGGWVSTTGPSATSGNAGNGVNATNGGKFIAPSPATLATTGNTLSGITSGQFGILVTGTVTSANNGVADQTAYYSNGGIIAAGGAGAGASAIGFNAPCAGLELCVNGNGEFDGTSLIIHNGSTGNTGLYADATSNPAGLFLRDGSRNGKWEITHIGSTSYDLRIRNDALGSTAMTIAGADNRTTFFGDQGTSGTIPTVSGTATPTIATGSTDTAGEVTAGTSATSVVITFAVAKTNAPFCVVTSQTPLASFAYSLSTTAITVTQIATTGNKIDYRCTQH